MKLLFLIGMPGAGKSYWGRQIAQTFQLPFTDLDKYIIKHEQTTIDLLFKQSGEEGFRQKEQHYLNKLIAEATTDMVIACGGGTPCYQDNLQLMQQSGTTIYLKAAPEQLLKNMCNTLDMRPMLSEQTDARSFLTTLLEKREIYYGQAHYILQTEYISLTTFAEIISSCTNRQ